MKRFFVAIFLICFSVFAFAQAQLPAKPKPKPETVALIANSVVAIIAGPIVVPIAAATGNLPGLCKVLEGTYDPTGADRCPGGLWTNVLAFWRSTQPAPKT